MASTVSKPALQKRRQRPRRVGAARGALQAGNSLLAPPYLPCFPFFCHGRGSGAFFAAGSRGALERAEDSLRVQRNWPVDHGQGSD